MMRLSAKLTPMVSCIIAVAGTWWGGVTCVRTCYVSLARSAIWRAARRVGLRCEPVRQLLQAFCKLLRAFLRRLALGWSKRNSQPRAFYRYRYAGDDAAAKVVKKWRHRHFR